MTERPSGEPMSIEIKMPRLSDTMDEGKIVEWKKKVGDPVEEGDILCVIETDKADVEFQSFYTGTLAEIRLQEGEAAPLGTGIAILAGDGEGGGRGGGGAPWGRGVRSRGGRGGGGGGGGPPAAPPPPSPGPPRGSQSPSPG